MESWRTLRDVVLFVGGLLIAGHETLLVSESDPQLLILAAGMMGLPGILRADGGRSSGEKGP